MTKFLTIINGQKIKLSHKKLGAQVVTRIHQETMGKYFTNPVGMKWAKMRLPQPVYPSLPTLSS